MKKLITKNTDEGIINSNGIIIDGDIALKTVGQGIKNRFLLIRTLIAIVASMCTVFMMAPFVEITSATLFPIVTTTIGFAAIRYSNSFFKMIGAAYLIIQTAYFFFMVSFEEIRIGFLSALKNYLDLAELNSASVDNELHGIKDFELEFCTENVLILAGFIIAILVSIACIVRFDFAILFVSTFPFFEIVIYHGWNPPILALLGLVTCWLLTAAISMINHYTNKAGIGNTFAVHRKKRSYYFTSKPLKERFFSVYLSVIAILCCAVFAFTMLFSSLTGFVRPKSFSRLRHEITNFVNDFSLDKVRDMIADSDGLFNIFDVKSVGGTNGGQLGRTDGISFDGSTALHIKIQSVPKGTLYLKGYTGGKYEDNSWNAVDNKLPQEITDYFSAIGRTVQDFNFLMCKSKGLYDFTNIISVSVVGASKRFAYAPYLTDFTTDQNTGKEKMDPTGENYVKQRSKKYQLEFVDISKYSSDDLNEAIKFLAQFDNSSTSVINSMYSQYVKEAYLEVTDSKGLNEAYNDIMQYIDSYTYTKRYFYDSDFDDIGSRELYDEEIDRLINSANAVKSYLSQFPYDLNPGKTPSDEDFIDYFLTKQKKGYCSYFATAGTMLMRKLGYPARYVEGYIVSPSDYVTDNDGQLSATVSDRSAHAWCEVFIDNIGWMPLEFTPGYSSNSNPNIDSQTTTTTTSETTTTAAPNTTPSTSDSSQSSTTTTTVPANEDPANTTASDNDDSEKEKTTAAAATDDNDSDNGGGFTRLFGFIALYVFIAVSVILIFLFRRRSKLRKQVKLTTMKDRSKAVKYIYLYYLKYLSLLKIQNNSNISDETEAYKLINLCKKNDLSSLSHDIYTLSQLAIEAQLSNTPVSQEEYEQAIKALKKLSREIVPVKLGSIARFNAKWLYGMY